MFDSSQNLKKETAVIETLLLSGGFEGFSNDLASKISIKEEDLRELIKLTNIITTNLNEELTKKSSTMRSSSRSRCEIKKEDRIISRYDDKVEEPFFSIQQNLNKDQDATIVKTRIQDQSEERIKSNRDPFRIRKSFSDYEYESNLEIKYEYANNSCYRGSLSSSPRINKSNYYMNNEQDFEAFKPALFFKSKTYGEEISFESILYRIYFEGYTYEDIKEHIYFPLRKVKNVDSFFELLFSVIKTYCIKIREHILGEIDEVILKKERLIKSKDGRFEIRNEFSGYKKFSKHISIYVSIINKLHELVQSLNIISKDIDKIIEIYLEMHSLNKKSIEFDCLELHRNMFIRYVQEAPLIKHFINEASIQFAKSDINKSKFSKIIAQVNELVQTQATQKNNQEISDKDNQNVSFQDGISQSAQNLIHSENENAAKEGSGKKKKKKKKNKSDKNSPIKQQEFNKENEKIIQTITPPSNPEIQKDSSRKKETELEEFEKKLLLEQSSNHVKIKPNISEEWVISLRQRLQKQKKN